MNSTKANAIRTRNQTGFRATKLCCCDGAPCRMLKNGRYTNRYEKNERMKMMGNVASDVRSSRLSGTIF